MKIGLLTSSRADFGIYLPLLKKLKEDRFFDLDIIAFGTHLSTFHGETIHQILAQGFEVKYKIESMLLTDSPNSISTAIGLTTIKFADFWKEHGSQYDLILCLGDRYEMFAAVISAIPYNISFAHLHGGETTIGAIDNIFRHAITLTAKYHFVSTDLYAKKVSEITGEEENVFCVGALSLDNLNSMKLLSVEEFKQKWNIDLSVGTILTTFHPETVNTGMNIQYAEELVKIIKNNIQYQFLITMPNADTEGNLIRQIFENELKNNSNVYLVENLGSQSYFTAMKHCAFLLGNTSSGIIEAASFGKYVINLGDRQKGRACGENVIHVAIKSNLIQKAIDSLSDSKLFTGNNIYFAENSAQTILNILKQIN